jgi:Fibronectin type III domain
MPMISQLPAATAVTAADEIPISQGGSACSISIGALLATTQPSIIIPQTSLLGRTSVGSGSPEGIEVGLGIELSIGTIVANGADHAGFPFASGLLAGAGLVVSDQGSQMLMPVASLRGLFTAGQNISIDANGVISSSAPGGGSSSFSINSLQLTSSVIAADTVPVSQNGTAYAISYSNFLNGLTIDQAPAAAPASDTDTVWVGQASNSMGAQTLGAIWTWIANAIPRYRPQVLEIVSPVMLSYTSHNGRMLVVTGANITIAPNFSSMGSGFYCDIVTNASGSVIWGAGIIATNGATGIPSNSYARLLACACSTGNIVMASVGPASSSSSTPVAAPGPVTALALASITPGSLAFNWSSPTTGGTASSYAVQYRVSGATTWIPVTANPVSPSITLTGLSSATSYDVEVAATNSGGASSYIQLLGVSTSTTLAVPGSPSALTVGTVTTSSVILTWAAPGSGGTPTGYTVEYSLDGGLIWSQPLSFGNVTSGTVTGLAAATTYVFRIAAANAAGSGAYAPTSLFPTAVTATAAATPGLPTTLTFTVISSTSMTVQWIAPSGTVTGYNLQYRVLNTVTWTVISSAITSATISGLTPSTTYEVQVQSANGSLTSAYTDSATNATAATANSGVYKLTPAPTRQSPTVGWVGTTIVMASGQPGAGYNVSDNSATSDGSHPVPAAVGFAWSGSNTAIPGITNAGGSGLALDGHNLWYTWTITYPSVPGNYYLWAIAKDSSGNVGGTCVSPTPFTLQ